MQELKEKLKNFFYYIDNEKNINVDKTIEKFKEIFKNEYFESQYSIKEAYYDYKNISLYLKNGNGLKFSIISGEGDRYGSTHTHEGRDLWITSKLAKDEEIRNGINIFYMNEYEKIKLSNLLEKFFDIDLSFESLEKNKDSNVYKTLSEDVKNSESVVKVRYSQLKAEAENQNREEIDYDLISPYGGLDVTIHPVPQILYDKILDFREDKYFYDRAMALFKNDFEEYINEEIKDCKDALYFIEHKDEYGKIFDTEFEIIKHNSGNPIFDIEEISENKAKYEGELKKLRKEYNLLSTRKYSLFDVILGTKKMDQQRMLELYNPITQDGIICKYEEKLRDNQLEENQYNSFIEYGQELEKKVEELKKQVDRPYRNFTLNEDFYDLVNDGVYFNTESLYKLVKKQD